MNKTVKILKYLIWFGLLSVCFCSLIIDSDFYFPYIVPKTLFFRVATEVLFVLYLILALVDKRYRPKLNLISLLFLCYLMVVFISSLLGHSFYFSFWGNNERSEGLLLLLHLWAYLIVLAGFLQNIRDWLLLFDGSFLSSVLVSLVALGQYLNFSWLLPSSGGSRLASTIGNAGYVAGYLIFNIFFGLFLIFFRKNTYLRFYYVLGILLQIFVVFNTLTRGGIIALVFSLAIFALYRLFYRSKISQPVKTIGLGCLLAVAGFTVVIFLNKNAAWVKNIELLDRIASISTEATTAQSRLLTWRSSYEGFKQKPILGYGYENFYAVFDKYFNPEIYRHAGSVIWFDRAHNIIFDRLITGGLVGLFLYLAMLSVPLFYLWRYFKRNKDENNYFVPVVVTLILIAYFIQNLFIFEALVTYIPLFIVLAFLAQFCPSYWDNFFRSTKPCVVLLTVVSICFLPVFFLVNVKPILANKDVIKAMVLIKGSQDWEGALAQFEELLAMNTYGNQEYRQHFGEFVSGTLNETDIDDDWKAMAALKAEKEFDKQIEEKNDSARNYLMFMRFLNRTYQYDPERLTKTLKLAEKGMELSPNRPQFYYERGYTYYYLGKYFRSLGKEDKVQEYFGKSIADMRKALELNNKVAESYVNVIMIALTTGETDLIQPHLDQMDKLGVIWRTTATVERIANSAISSGEYGWTNKFYLELVELEPQNTNYWINLALSYAYLDNKDKAVEIAERIKKLGGNYETEADVFIADVLAGKYKK